jgi:peptide deformylase
MKRDILQVGEPVLRQHARPLSTEEIRSPAIQELIAAMREIMRQAPGVGLAAPQIGYGLQMAVIEDREDYLAGFSPAALVERERAPVPFHVVINPRLAVADATTIAFFEGCLSLDGFAAIVPRARAVRVECLNERGDPQLIEARGWYARILQHEIDHLTGTLYIDRMLSRSFMSVDNLTQYWRDKTMTEIYTAFDLRARRPRRSE